VSFSTGASELVLVLVLGLGLAIVIVLDSRQQLGQRRGRHGSWAFDHEKLDVYRLAILFSSWVGEQLEGKQLLERIVSMLWRMSKASHRIRTTARKSARARAR
jgi:hypothetical protein